MSTLKKVNRYKWRHLVFIISLLKVFFSLFFIFKNHLFINHQNKQNKTKKKPKKKNTPKKQRMSYVTPGKLDISLAMAQKCLLLSQIDLIYSLHQSLGSIYCHQFFYCRCVAFIFFFSFFSYLFFIFYFLFFIFYFLFFIFYFLFFIFYFLFFIFYFLFFIFYFHF